MHDQGFDRSHDRVRRLTRNFDSSSVADMT